MRIDKAEFQRTILNSVFCLFLWAWFVYLQYENPFAFIYLIAEDWWGEYATFVSYIVAFGLMAASMKVDKRLIKPGLILMALGFLFIAMEEISWGYRLFNIKLPYVINKLNNQSELNFHNAVDLSFTKLFCYVLIVWIFIFPILSGRIKAVGRWLDTIGVPKITLSSTPCFLLAIFMILSGFLVKGDELGELMLGIAFVCYATEIFVRTMNSSLNRKFHYSLSMCCLLILVVGLTGFFVAISSKATQAKQYNWKLYYSAAVNYPEHKLYNQAGKMFEYMISNSAFRHNEDFLMEYGAMLQKIGSPKADYILRKALGEQRRYIKEKPDQAKYYRRTGKILIMLNDTEQAGLEFQTALGKDRLRLQRTKDESEKSDILFSMGKTYFEMKDYASAVDHARKAYALSPTKEGERIIKEWIEEVEK